MRTLRTALVAVAGSLALAGAARAADEKPVSFSFSIGASTDYVFRGVSQTNEDPSVFGSVDASIGSIGYAGVWASNVDLDDSTDAELDIYGGIRPTLGAVTLDLGVIYYGYIDQPSGADYDYWEGKLAASAPAGPASLGVAIYYSPDFLGLADEAWYSEANVWTTIPQTKFSVSGAVGRQQVEGARDYTTWNLGLGYALTHDLGLDLRYYDTDGHEFGKLFDSRIVGSIKLTW